MIRILPDALVNKIAAGEVVERPASVVKELVENAVDAGARRVDVVLRQGGKAQIRVADDGRGMGRQDALLCIERHATSKILDEDDLFAIATLGFRGEALPSIASVSRFEVQTRPADEPVGTRLRLEGGKLVAVDDAGGPPGTVIDVRQLFFNVPARRKFLRADATELGHCVEVVTREAIGRPDVAFSLRADDRELLRTNTVGDPLARVREILGETGRALIEVAFESEGIAVAGLVSPPELHRGDPAGTAYLYVNGRFVRDAVVRRAVNDAYAGLLPKGRYPVVVLSVRLPPDRVDVNVHPAKTEVRFQDPFQLVRVVSGGVRAAVAPGIPAELLVAEPAGVPAAPALPVAPWVPPVPRPLPPLAGPPPTLVPTPGPLGAPPPRLDPATPLPLRAPVAPEAPVGGPLGRPLGRWGPWLVCDAGPELVLVDARGAATAAEERTLRGGVPDVQELAPPRRIDLSAAAAADVRGAIDALADLGFGVAPLGANTFAVTRAPARLGGDLAARIAGIAASVDADTRRWRLAEALVDEADDPGAWRRWLAAVDARVRVVRLRREDLDRRGRT